MCGGVLHVVVSWWSPVCYMSDPPQTRPALNLTHLARTPLPLLQIRDLYWTFRNFQQRVRDFLRYRRLTANMDTRFPTATEADLERAGHTCIICREDLALGQRPKRLACGHVFHVHCLRSWLERQQLCPICRAPVVEPRPAERPVAWGPIQPDPLAQVRALLRRRPGQQGAAAAGQPGAEPAPPPAAVPHRPRPRQFRPDDPSAPPELRNAVAHHQQASAATSFVLAACLAPEGQGMAAPHRQALRELLQTPGMRDALRAAAQGLQATLSLQARAIGRLLDELGPEEAAGGEAGGDAPREGDAGAQQSASGHEAFTTGLQAPGQPSTAEDAAQPDQSAGRASPSSAASSVTHATPPRDPDESGEAAEMRRRRLARFASTQQP